MMALTVTTYNQAHHFRFCLGGGANAHKAEPKTNFAPQVRKNFLKANRSIPPLKTVFSSDFAHSEMKIQVFLYFVVPIKPKIEKKLKGTGTVGC